MIPKNSLLSCLSGKINGKIMKQEMRWIKYGRTNHK